MDGWSVLLGVVIGVVIALGLFLTWALMVAAKTADRQSERYVQDQALGAILEGQNVRVVNPDSTDEGQDR